MESRNASQTVPQGDNSNFGRVRNFTSFATPWPEEQKVADVNAAAARVKLSSLRELSAKVNGHTIPTEVLPTTTLAPRPAAQPGASWWRPKEVLTPLNVSPKLPDWTPLPGGDSQWSAFTTVPTETPKV